MRNIRFIFFLLFFSFCCSCQNHAQLAYKVVGTYKGKTAQGMAIYNDTAYIFSDGGHFRVYDLKSSKVIRELNLESSANSCHVNSACFGNKFKDNNVPLIYITEYQGQRRCFVENIKNDQSELIQSIKFEMDDDPVFVRNWSVDADNNYIYALYTTSMDKKNKKVCNRIAKFHLPDPFEKKDVVLTKIDVIDSFDIYFHNGIQGGKIKDGYWYISSGLQETANDKFDSDRAIIVVDLENKKIDRIIDLSLVSMNEPEDIDFYDDGMLLFCGQTGGLYFLNYK